MNRYNLIAAAMMHMEGFFSVKSRAFRNHNPGNIEDHFGNYKRYPTMQEGYDALVADVEANKGFPLKEFIFKYAPPNENNSLLYAQTVATLTGVGLEEII